MRKPTLVAEALVFTFLVVMGTTLPAQNSSFTLGSGTGTPGLIVQLPIYLTLPRNLQMERILAIVEYPSFLAYHQVELAKDAKTNGVVIEVKDTSPQTDGKMKRMEITLKGGKEKLLQSGLVGSLSFTIDKEARTQMVALLVTEAKGFPKGGGAEIKLRGDPGSVTVYEAGMEPLPVPMVGCFFFTH